MEQNKFYEVVYSNYNFRDCFLGVRAENKESAIEKVRYYETNRRVEIIRVSEISEAQFFEYLEEAWRQEDVRFCHKSQMKEERDEK